jgi:hypothetical protein
MMHRKTDEMKIICGYDEEGIELGKGQEGT